MVTEKSTWNYGKLCNKQKQNSEFTVENIPNRDQKKIKHFRYQKLTECFMSTESIMLVILYVKITFVRLNISFFYFIFQENNLNILWGFVDIIIINMHLVNSQG